MVPTYYTSEKYSVKYEGFKLHLDKVKDGDTANLRTIPHKYRPSGNENSGFAFEVKTKLSDRVYVVREIQKWSFLEVLAFIFGFAAGCILIARLAKCFLQDQEYFKAKDRECTMLFGAWGDKEADSKFSIDMAAAAHRNKVREQNDYITEESDKHFDSPDVEQPR